MREIRKRSGFAAVLVSVLLLAPAMLAAQSSVEPGFNLFSVEQEIEIGRQSAREVESQLPLLNDRSVEAYVDAVGQRLAVEAPHGDYPYQFKVLNIADVNAFALPAGFMYLNRGLVETVRNESELAGVLAHEIAHDDLNHVAKAQTLGAGLNIGMIILDQIFPGSGAITPIAGQLIARRYSQKEEYAADQHGADLLQKVGMPRQIMADTLAWLMQTSGGSSGGFFATHPATADRIEALR